ncbi:UDP-glucose dehydrogenase family protein [Alicyclobacillus pomorum]|uniref:UDP-glucose dehydrogenase family protein n=1 Tax=Alicyclobacillus pomorum TaxID=204470 RepID=UPI000406A0E9|nr:UDP-glucose/GDP-mannose dehydrogenase family protein [Alicyclobacillus pomorum]
MNVLVIGTGYVGLVTGLCFAKLGHKVTCVDKDSDKIARLQRGQAPIYEPGLEGLLQEQIAANMVKFSTIIPTPNDADIALIAVGTPALASGEADLSAVFAAVDELAHKLPRSAVLGTKSTVPVGTALRIQERLSAAGRTDISVVSVPEFLREGSAVEDTFHPHRLVFGVMDQRGTDVLSALHEGLDAPIVVTDTSTAEMIKYASNAFLATKISFINEIANICERVGADVSKVATGMGLDPRIGSSFLRAGLGYGGSCFPKDTRALVNIAGSVQYDFQLLKAVVEVNQRQRLQPMNRLREWLTQLQGKVVVLLGVSFKPGTDDIRESPALELTRDLKNAGAIVRHCDPVVKEFLDDDGQPITVTDDPFEALQGADAAVLVTEWPLFTKLDWNAVGKVMNQKFLFDGRNVLQREIVESAGFVFSNVGYNPSVAYATI